MRRIESNGVLGDTLCHNWGIRRNSEWAVVRGASVRAARSPRGAAGAAHLPGNLSLRPRRQQWNRSHDVYGGVAFH